MPPLIEPPWAHDTPLARCGASPVKHGEGDMTYYYWKRAAAPSSDSGDLRDLVALEEENKRLKNLLADRLRKENAELKKRLGLA